MMSFSTESWPDLLRWLYYSIYWITLVSVILVVVLDNRDPVKTIAWVMVLIFLPYIGLILYVFFGQRYRKQKIISKKSIRSIENNPAYLYEELDALHYPPDCEALIDLLRKSNLHPVFSGNEIRLLTNGKDKFDALFKDIAQARKHIHLDYFIIENGYIGNELQQLLIKKAKEGIQVRVIYDDIGSWKTKQSYFKEMKDAGIQVYPFLRVLLPYLSPKFNYRNHRKIAVIDGEIGYTGGMNVADRYVGIGNYPLMRDTQVRIVGKGVYGLQTAFLIDWFFVSRDLLTSKFFFPDLKDHGSCLVQVATSGPDTDWESIMQAFFSIIGRAKRYVYIQTPYFLPNESLLTVLQVAAMSGVDVRLMVPESTDTPLASLAMHSHFSEVMAAGVKIYRYRKGFLHAKTLVCDDSITTVGSTNFDYRSFELDFEVNAFIYDADFAKRMKETFLQDMKDSVYLDPEAWLHRRKTTKWVESVSRLFGPLM